MTRRTLRLVSAIVLVTLVLASGQLRAQSDPGALHLTTSPLPISLKTKPGTTIDTELRVRNSGTKTEQLKVGLMKFSAFGEEGKPELKEREPGDDYFDWVTFSKTQLTAAPNEWQSVTMKITLPKTAALGYYYAVTFSRANPSAADQGKTAVRGGSATLVLLEADVPGAKRSVEIQAFEVDRRSYEFLPVQFKTRLKNTGNIHTAPSGTIFINRGKKEVGQVPVNATKGNILPNSGRVFNAAWADGFPVYQVKQQDGRIVLKDGQPDYELKWDASKLRQLRFGKYTATLVMAYDDGQRDVPLEATVSFWVIPWRLIGLAIAIPAVPALLVYLLMKRRMKKHLQKRPAHEK